MGVAINDANAYNDCIISWKLFMASMTIRDLDDRLKQRLRVQAAHNNRSMEEEARAILKAGLSGEAGNARSLYKSIRARIESVKGLEISISPRQPIRDVEID